MVQSDLDLELGKLKIFPTRLGIIPCKNVGAFLSANMWLQLGWIPPCEVSKNLVYLVPFSVGKWIHSSFLVVNEHTHGLA
jgi:hypothetical protein